MATNTTNLSLIKPDLTDKIRIAQINQNMDIIDEKLGPVGSTSLQSQVTPLTTKTANYDKLIENGTDLNSLLTTGVYKSPATAAGVHTLSNCPVETPFVMVVRGEGTIDGCVQLLCGGVSIYTRRGTGSGFPAEWTVPTGGATPSGEYSIDDLYDAIDELLADAKDEIVEELVDDTAGIGETGKVWSADKLATSFDEKANIDGYYDTLTAGNAEQLISTIRVKDTALYNFRTAGGNADIGDREVDKLIGGTVVWNQMMALDQFCRGNQNMGRTDTYNGVTFTLNADNSITVTGTPTDRAYVYVNSLTKYKFAGLANHVIYKNVAGEMPTGVTFGGSAYDANGTWISTVPTGAQSIAKYPANTKNSYALVLDVPASIAGTTLNFTVRVNMYDLTQMFGSTIADYIYSLETATAGAGVAWFKRYFPKPYYEYNAGELMSVNAASHNMVGFNAFDGETEPGTFANPSGAPVSSNTRYRSKNYIPVVPGATYYAYYGTSVATIYSMFYDMDKNLIENGKFTNITNKTFTVPSNAAFMRFTNYNASATYMNDVCINLSWDGERDGEYEEYVKHSYSIGNVELRGVPKLDAENHLQYDGDTYESDGTVTRKYGIVDLGTLTWSAWNPDTSLVFNATLPGKKNQRVVADCICPKYTYKGNISLWSDLQNGMMTGNIQNSSIYIRDNNYKTKEAFAAAMSGVYLVYELATPTTESADSYQNPQIVDDFGTEEYIDRGVATSARDVAIPVGHETYYQANLRAKLEMAPNSPADGDGDYVVRQTSGTNEYIKLENAEAIADLDAKKADIDGYYEQMTVGNAEQLVSTVGITDKVPYNFRTSGGSADIGDREVDKLIGGTVAWNQIVKNGNFMDATLGWVPENAAYASVSASNGVLTLTAIQTPTAFYNLGIKNNQMTPIVGHKYLFHAEVNSPVGNMVFGMRSVAFDPGTMIEILTSVADQWTSGYKIVNCNGTGANTTPYFAPKNITGFENGSVIKWRNIFIIDLTQMFGSTIADYIYSLETANAGAGVVWFCKLFPKPYYAYDAGTLMSVQAKEHITVGFNALDENRTLGTLSGTSNTTKRVFDYSKYYVGLTANNYYNPSYVTATYNDGVATITNNHSVYGIAFPVKVLPNTTYCLSYTLVSGSSGTNFGFYDIDGNYISNFGGSSSKPRTVTTPANCYIMTVVVYPYTYNTTTSVKDFCINLHWDGERDGEYEPYVLHSYPLGDVELRGIPKLDSDNKLYYDGDTYEADGAVTRKYGVVDLGTLTWKKSQSGLFYTDELIGVVKNSVYGTIANAVSPIYEMMTSSITGPDGTNPSPDKRIAIGTSGQVYVNDLSFTDTAAFKTAMSGVIFVYELATPTTESADPFQNPQIVDDFGTEEYVDRAATATTNPRDVAISVGHETVYQPNLRAKLEMSPDSPDGDGDYIVRQSNGENIYVPLVIPTELPTAPTTDGTYVLKVTVSSGTPTLTWVAQ